MDIAPYDPNADKQAVSRILVEIGWVTPGEKRQEWLADVMLKECPTLVARLDGEAECFAARASGTIRHLDADLPFCGIAGVGTSRIARKRGLAIRTTARAVAAGAAEGAQVCGLGVFDHGFYDRLGFGTGTYDHAGDVSPRQLRVPVPDRRPCRLTDDDWQEIHDCRRRRVRPHGSLNFDAGGMTRADMLECRNAFGLGFRDPAGTLTHCLFFSAENVEGGPYRVRFMAYRTAGELLELLGLLKSLEEQVGTVNLTEPPGVQLQSVIERPFGSKGIKFTSAAYWQARMLDVPACVGAVRLRGDAVRFNLSLSDPIGRYLDSGEWRGVAGDYVVTLGPESAAQAGTEPGLPAMTASVNAFTRLWLGVGPATGLAVTDDLNAPPELLEQLEEALRLPKPCRDWEF